MQTKSGATVFPSQQQLTHWEQHYIPSCSIASSQKFTSYQWQPDKKCGNM